jgi:hypothetical protein
MAVVIKLRIHSTKRDNRPFGHCLGDFFRQSLAIDGRAAVQATRTSNPSMTMLPSKHGLKIVAKTAENV